jgi:hypothetical protein
MRPALVPPSGSGDKPTWTLGPRPFCAMLKLAQAALSRPSAIDRPIDLGYLTAMGHFVTGLIARPAVLEAFSREHSLHWPVALLGDLAILPLREIDLDSFQAAPSYNAAGACNTYPSSSLMNSGAYLTRGR